MRQITEEDLHRMARLHRAALAHHAKKKRYYVFYYEYEHLWGDPKKRRIRVSKRGRPKEYQGPFDTKAAASRALMADARKYGTMPSDYKVKYLTPAGFARAWN
jgi:hypothetical protein